MPVVVVIGVLFFVNHDAAAAEHGGWVCRVTADELIVIHDLAGGFVSILDAEFVHAPPPNLGRIRGHEVRTSLNSGGLENGCVFTITNVHTKHLACVTRG